MGQRVWAGTGWAGRPRGPVGPLSGGTCVRVSTCAPRGLSVPEHSRGLGFCTTMAQPQPPPRGFHGTWDSVRRPVSVIWVLPATSCSACRASFLTSLPSIPLSERRRRPGGPGKASGLWLCRPGARGPLCGCSAPSGGWASDALSRDAFAVFSFEGQYVLEAPALPLLPKGDTRADQAASGTRWWVAPCRVVAAPPGF